MAIAPDVLDSKIEPSRTDGPRREFVRGAWLEKPHMGAEAALISTRLMFYLFGHVEATKAGYCASHECGYKIFEHEPKRVRYPDGSFIRAERLGGVKIPRGYSKIVPDLIFEVVSPKDRAENVEERVMDFLKAGVKLVWVIYPSTHQVCVFRQGPAALRLGESDILEGEDVVPGFACSLQGLFAEI